MHQMNNQRAHTALLINAAQCHEMIGWKVCMEDIPDAVRWGKERRRRHLWDSRAEMIAHSSRFTISSSIGKIVADPGCMVAESAYVVHKTLERSLCFEKAVWFSFRCLQEVGIQRRMRGSSLNTKRRQEASEEYANAHGCFAGFSWTFTAPLYERI